jgi:cyclophilin family peptidyl-prolyl cis-trans isomerase
MSNEYINLTEDGGVKKKLLSLGSGDQPSNNNEIIISFTSTIDNKTTKKENFRFSLGNNEVNSGLEIAVKSMKINEKSSFIISPEYSNNEKNSIYEIILLQILPPLKKISEMDFPEKLSRAKMLKNEGVEKYKENEFEIAAEKFLKSIEFIKNSDEKNEDQIEGFNLLITLLTNLSNCYNHLKNYEKVMKFTEQALKLKPNAKNYYFRSIASVNIGNLNEAEKNLTELKKFLNENDEGIKYVQNLIENQKKIQNVNKKKFSKNIFKQKLYDDKPNNFKPNFIPEKINENNPKCFFEIQIGKNDENLKRIEFELFKDHVPKTSENFRCLCTGEKNLHYKNSIFHRIIKDFAISGGDFENNDGTGGKSIYGKTFEDENFYYAHNKEGILTMANSGKNTNGSQFFITLKETPWLDGKNVVFGRVIKGMDVVNEIAEVETDGQNKPEEEVKIVNCGEIK